MVASASISSEILTKYEPVIGLERHVQLLTQTRLLRLLGEVWRAA